jgi:RecA-family ATPase
MWAIAAKPPQDRIIDRLLIRGGLTIAAADPKCGKSMLARNAVMAVLRGGEFLGRKCVPGPVIYYAMEGDQTETLQHLYQLGLAEETEELLGFRGGAIPRLRFLDLLRRDIEAKGAVLAVIDPLGDALLLKDINNYMEVNYAIKPLNDIAAKTGCHILALHHTNKNGAGGDPRSFLGSAQLAGATDCNMMLWKNGRGERFIRTEHRYVYDTPIMDTSLVFNKDTGVVSLGAELTAEEKKAAKAAEREEAILV